MHFSGKIIPSFYQWCCLSLILLSNVSLADQPVVASNAYFGGGGDEQVNAVTTDASGNIYLTGWTRSAGLPGSGATGTSLSSGQVQAQDAFVTKLDSAGNVLFTRYIGAGASSFEDKEEGRAITVDDTGTIYVIGTLAGNVHFSGTVGAYDNCDNGNVDAFLAVLDNNGALTYLSCFGGSAADYASGMVLNSDGSVTIIGYTQSDETTFPLKNAFQQTKDAYSSDAFIVRLSPSGQGADDLLFASYLGGDGIDKANALDTDAQGNLYIVGSTGSTNLSSVDTLLGINDVFVARLNRSMVVTSGYDIPQYVRLFGVTDSIAGCDSGTAIAVDSQHDRLFLTGRFESQGAFIAGMDTSGQNITSAVVGGSMDASGCGVTTGQAIVLDGDGGGIIGGLTAANDLPVPENTYGDLTDGFITRFDAGLNLLYTYYLGGSAYDAIHSISRSDNGFLYVAGRTESTDWVNDGSSSLQGPGDVLTAMLNPQVDLSIDAITQIPLLVGGIRQFDITLRNSGPDSAHDISFEIFPPIDYPGDISIAQGDCNPTLISSILCSLSGVDLPAGSTMLLTVTVSSVQQGSWLLDYGLTSSAHEQVPGDNQGNLALLFVDQLPPTIGVNDGSTAQASGGGGTVSGGLIILLCLVFLSGCFPAALYTRKFMK